MSDVDELDDVVAHTRKVAGVVVAEDHDPSFKAFMAGCRHPDCKAEHRRISSKPKPRNGSGTKKDKALNEARDVDSSFAQVITAAGSAAPSGTNAPTSGAWESVIGVVAMFVLVQWALWVCDRDESTAAPLTPTDDEIDALVRPLARMVAQTNLNKKYGRAIVGNSDVLEALIVLEEIAERMWDPTRDKFRRDRGRAPMTNPRGPQHDSQQVPQSFAASGPNGAGVPITGALAD